MYMKHKLRIDSNMLFLFITRILPLFLLCFNYVLYNSLGVSVYKMPLRIIAMSLIIFGGVLRKKEAIDIRIMFFFFIILLETIYNSDETLNIIAGLLFAICGSDDIEEEKKVLYYVSILIVALFFLFLIFGMVESRTYISTMGRERTTLGFENPNVASLFLSSVLYLYILSKKYVNTKHLVVACSCGMLVYFYTDSRASFVSFMCFLILVVLLKNDKIKKCTALVYICDSFFILHFFSMFITEKLMPLNNLLSGRISHFVNMTTEAGVSRYIFGGSPFRSDNFYYMLMFKYGIIVYFLFLIIVHSALMRLCRNGCNKEVFYVFAHLLLGFMESSIIRPEIASVMMFWILLFSQNKFTINTLKDRNNR